MTKKVLNGVRLGVAGAGVFGLSVALRASEAGAAVHLFDPRALADNASGIAAGMIAPVGESLFESGPPPPGELLRAARDGWEGLASLAPGLAVERPGADYRFSGAALLARARALEERWEVEVEIKGEEEGRLITREDWRVDPKAAMGVMEAALLARGARLYRRGFGLKEQDGFDAVVLSAGIHSRAFAGAAPELLSLRPIKGHILRFLGAGRRGPMRRDAGLYLVSEGADRLAGATMEYDQDDPRVDPSQLVLLRRRALEAEPDLEAYPFEGAAGVRASAPDGLPLAGPSSATGLLIAAGARRNGWLFAPLVGEMVVSYLSGGEPAAFGPLLDPRRFAITAG